MNLNFFKCPAVGLAAFVLASTGLATGKKLTLDELFPADRVLDVQITVAERTGTRYAISHATSSPRCMRAGK